MRSTFHRYHPSRRSAMFGWVGKFNNFYEQTSRHPFASSITIWNSIKSSLENVFPSHSSFRLMSPFIALLFGGREKVFLAPISICVEQTFSLSSNAILNGVIYDPITETLSLEAFYWPFSPSCTRRGGKKNFRQSIIISRAYKLCAFDLFCFRSSPVPNAWLAL